MYLFSFPSGGNIGFDELSKANSPILVEIKSRNGPKPILFIPTRDSSPEVITTGIPYFFKSSLAEYFILVSLSVTELITKFDT
jgi:hypothetical protein